MFGCAKVRIKNQRWCGDIGTQGAICYHTLTDQELIIPQPQWDNERFGQICTHDPPDQRGKTFAEIKTWLEQLCALSKRCKYPEHEKIMEFFDKAIDASRATPKR